MRELRLPVGPEVLVAKATRDAKVSIEPGDDQQLLVQLWRLRQRIEFARVHPTRHYIVASTFGRRLGENRSLDLEVALVVEKATRRLLESVAENQVPL
ncbi:MAG: hypothetical protein AUI63_01045 [Gemmatimonadetes bacterium 13_1_40CM_2_60_3]|nr:MAG: hypothetical protein AUI63_01045 [Gemmatimonadetes bacterium 13_1_40CM_2_60_3]